MVVLVACGDDDDVVRSIDSGIDASNDDANVVNPGDDANVVNPGDDAAIEGTFQCDQDAGLSVEIPDGWFASKLTHDVWWQGHPYRDPGRGAIEIVALSKAESTGTATKICGVTLPPFTSDQTCEAYQLTIPDDAWDSPQMPRFMIDGRDAGNGATALIGVDFLDGQEERAWPTSMMTGAIACEGGTGPACFPDHDGDSVEGITGRYRIDGTTYVGPYDDGRCTQGPAYTYAGGIVQTVCFACGGADQDVRADQVRLGLRTQLAGVGSAVDACAASFDQRAYDCTVDPATLDPGDPRITSQDYRCMDIEAQRLDDEQPAYRMLARGESPGDSQRPLGWTVANRDIDRRISEGTRSSFVRLADLADTEPTCAQVRAAFPTE